MTEQDRQIVELNSTVRCKLGVSKIEGVGVIAIRDIQKGEKLYCRPQMQGELRWYNVPFGSFGKFIPEVRELILQRWPSVVNGSLFLSPNDMMWMVTFINHSEENANYDINTDTASQDIPKGAEVLENYKLMSNYQKVYPWIKD